MSWQERVNNITFQITTGDGNVWSPRWFPRSKTVETNNTIYDYPELQGSYVERKLAKGDKFTFDVVFEGDLCIDNSEQFLVSAKDPRAWTVQHPYFGTLTIQPLKITVDNSRYNVSRLTIDAVDTLLSELQFSESEFRGTLLEIKANLDVSLETTYVSALEIPLASDSVVMEDDTKSWDEIQSSTINTQRELAEFKKIVNDTIQAVTNLIVAPTQAIRQFNTLLEYPFRVRDSVQARFNSFTEQYARARNALTELSGNGTKATTARKKQYFATQGASLVASACLVSVLEPDAEPNEEDSEETLNYSIKKNYLTRSDVVDQIDRIKAFYNDFLADSDVLETERADKENSYHLPNSVSFGLSQVVTETIRNLESQIFGALQERSYQLATDSNIYVLAHRFLGSASDENVAKLIELNDIGLNELLGIRKGREIIYYV